MKHADIVDFQSARRNKQSAFYYAELIQEFKKLIALTETVILASMRHVSPDELRNAEAALNSYREQMNEAIRGLERLTPERA
jgi:hypothetical protein